MGDYRNKYSYAILISRVWQLNRMSGLYIIRIILLFGNIIVAT